MTRTETVQRHLIGGEWRDSESGSTFVRTNPYNGEVATVAAGAGRADARAAVDAAAAAFGAWASTPAAERQRALEAAAGLLDERAPEIAAAMVEECGGTFGWGMFNCMLAAGMLRAAGALAG